MEVSSLKGHRRTFSNPSWIRAEWFAEHLVRTGTHSAGCTKPKRRRMGKDYIYSIQSAGAALVAASDAGRSCTYLKKLYATDRAFDQSL